MSKLKVLWAANAYWNSPFRVGAHHLVRELVARGFEAAFVSDPVSPWHFLRPSACLAARDRLADWARGGGRDLDGALYHYSPLAVLPPHNAPLLRSRWVLESWHRWTFPDAVERLRREGFGAVDLLVVDTPAQHFWFDAVRARRTVFRVTDFFSAFPKATPAFLKKEEALARRADLTVYTARSLEKFVKGLRPKDTLFLPNGVDPSRFEGDPGPRPAEYGPGGRPVAVYAGALAEWFRPDWIAAAARRRPDVLFALIGPEGGGSRALRQFPNVARLGPRRPEDVPRYLRHADVGLIPFDAEGHRALVSGVNPLKLYEYLAAGLPVVSADWGELRGMRAPVRLVQDAEGFARAVDALLRRPPPRGPLRAFAARHAWPQKADALLSRLGFRSSRKRR